MNCLPLLRPHWEVKFPEEFLFACRNPKEKCPWFSPPWFLFLPFLRYLDTIWVSFFFFLPFSLFYLLLKWLSTTSAPPKLHSPNFKSLTSSNVIFQSQGRVIPPKRRVACPGRELTHRSQVRLLRMLPSAVCPFNKPAHSWGCTTFHIVFF